VTTLVFQLVLALAAALGKNANDFAYPIDLK
jgi:hypothetical protein